MRLLTSYFFIFIYGLLIINLNSEQKYIEIIYLLITLSFFYPLIEEMNKVKFKKQKIHRLIIVGMYSIFIFTLGYFGIYAMLGDLLFRREFETFWYLEYGNLFFIAMGMYLKQIMVVKKYIGAAFLFGLIESGMYYYFFCMYEGDYRVLLLIFTVLFFILELLIIKRVEIDVIGWVPKTNLGDFKMLDSVFGYTGVFILLVIVNLLVGAFIVSFLTGIRDAEILFKVIACMSVLFIPNLYLMLIKDVNGVFDVSVFEWVKMIAASIFQMLLVYVLIVKYEMIVLLDVINVGDLYIWFIFISLYVILFNIAQFVSKTGERRYVVVIEGVFKLILLMIAYAVWKMRYMTIDRVVAIGFLLLFIVYLMKIIRKVKSGRGRSSAPEDLSEV